MLLPTYGGSHSGTKRQKNCATCNKDLGLVSAQQQYCAGCKKKRVIAQKRESYDRLVGNVEPVDYSPPSPCYVTADGKEKPCHNFDLCEAKRIACRSYWAYFHHKTQYRDFVDGRDADYLKLERVPNKGFYEASFNDDFPVVKRREAIRILSLVEGDEFEAMDFIRVDSFMVGPEKRRVLSSLVKAGIVKHLYGGLPYKKHPHIIHTHPVYGPPTYGKVGTPELIQSFLGGEKNGADPASGREDASQTSPTSDLTV